LASFAYIKRSTKALKAEMEKREKGIQKRKKICFPFSPSTKVETKKRNEGSKQKKEEERKISHKGIIYIDAI